jgi:hypothetical protein
MCWAFAKEFCVDRDAHRKALAVNFEDENLISKFESHFVFDLRSQN